jgi:hypothetical protein
VAAREDDVERVESELARALEWMLPLGVCCAEAQADGVPCGEPGGDCLRCDRADPLRRLLLEAAIRPRAVSPPA